MIETKIIERCKKIQHEQIRLMTPADVAKIFVSLDIDEMCVFCSTLQEELKKIQHKKMDDTCHYIRKIIGVETE